jgi:hypothetical protein
MLEHCVDWDMWKRIAVRKPMFYEPEPLACYRLHAAAESGRAIRTAENVVEERLSIDLSMFDIAPHKGRQIRRQARRLAGVRAACRARLRRQRGHRKPAWRQFNEASLCSLAPPMTARLVYMLLRVIV